MSGGFMKLNKWDCAVIFSLTFINYKPLILISSGSLTSPNFLFFSDLENQVELKTKDILEERKKHELEIRENENKLRKMSFVFDKRCFPEIVELFKAKGLFFSFLAPYCS
jgi:predicted phosphatase